MALVPPFDAISGQDTRRFYEGGAVPDDWIVPVLDQPIDFNCVGLYVGGAGDVAVFMCQDGLGQTARIFKAVPAGSILPGRFYGIASAGTTATNLLAAIYR